MFTPGRYCLVLVVLGLSASVAFAQQPPRPDKPGQKKEEKSTPKRESKKEDKGADKKDEKKGVDLQVWTIRASTRSKEISPELKEMADKLKDQFKYTGFKLEKRVPGQAALGRTFSTPLIGGFEAKITPQKAEGKRITVRVEVANARETKINTMVTFDAGTYQLVGGPSLDGGDALIVAVSAR
jgi:hypothetical protein